MKIENLIRKLILKKDIDLLYGLQNSSLDSIDIGDLRDFEPKPLIQIMDIWCKRLDKVIEIDTIVNDGKPSKRSHFLNYWRGFSYEEFKALFNSQITPEQFPFYPVFNQLRKKRGGIKTEKQRSDLLLNYSYDAEAYIELLCQVGLEPLLKSFFSQFAKLGALLPVEKLKQHVYISSPTGTGKSELLRVLFHRMVKKYPKFSFILIDPHGSLAYDAKKLKSIGGMKDRLIYIEPFLKDGYTPIFNPFEIKDLSLKNLTFTAEQIIYAIEETLSREGGKMTEIQINMLEKCIYFLLSRGTSTILDLVDLLNVENQIFDEAKRYNPTFFNDNFSRSKNSTRLALKSRIERLLNSPILRNFLGGNSTFNLEQIINNGKILIVNLGDVGEMSQVMIGKFLVASIKSNIRKRKKNLGIPTFLFVDEVQSMISGSFEYILSQLRGFGLHCVMANQYITQLGSQAEAVKQNTAIKVAGGDDMDEINKTIKFSKNTQLKDYEFILKVRGYNTRIFKSPNTLIKNKRKYEISSEEENALDQYQIEKYYRLIGEELLKPKENISSEKTIDNIAPIPPYHLQLPN